MGFLSEWRERRELRRRARVIDLIEFDTALDRIGTEWYGASQAGYPSRGDVWDAVVQATTCGETALLKPPTVDRVTDAVVGLWDRPAGEVGDVDALKRALASGQRPVRWVHR